MSARILMMTWAGCLFPIVAVYAADEEASSGLQDRFQPLYNGKDLSGWEIQGGKIEAWAAEGELLSCVAEGGGWLRTKKKYSDFVLRLEFKIPPGGNSGVGLRFPPTGDPAHDGMEIQILDDDADIYKDLKAAQYSGGVYYQAPAKRGYLQAPGEWNTYEITCLGPHVKVVLNSAVINDVMLDKYTKAEGDYKALADRPEIGYVGLQSHGSRVDFRNLQINDLTTTTKSGLTYVDIVEGKGEEVPPGATVTVHYTGRLLDGKKFDSSRDRGSPATFPLSGVIRGWTEGIPGMRIGGRRKLIIPPDLAYGSRGFRDVIPANATLVFDVEVKDIQ